MIKAEVIADSIGRHKRRITTFVLTYPRFIHAELMTHRVLSRNAASSRAIPISKMIDDVKKNPARPVHWGRQQKGMQAHEALDRSTAEQAIRLWDGAARNAIQTVEQMVDLGVHKQVANRLLEPFAHITTLVTATEMENFFALRADPDAQPEFQVLAFDTLQAYIQSTPKVLNVGDWHIPFGDRMPEGLSIEQKLKIATARAARISYLTFNGVIDPGADYFLHDRLMFSGHWSPFEHCAQLLEGPDVSGNFTGWLQYRKTFLNENRSGVDLNEIAAKRKFFEWEDFQSELLAA